ncbi:MAG: hypothetical protein ACLQOZ_04965 [Acidimicrobiales bacterium]
MTAVAEPQGSIGTWWRAVALSTIAIVLLGVVVAAGGTASAATVTGTGPAPHRPHIDTGPGAGYWMVAADGGIFSYGAAMFYGSTGGTMISAPIVGMAAVPDGGGYWEVGANGAVYAFGDAEYYGGTFLDTSAKPTVGMAATPDGHGYWLVGTDGGIFAFGDAGFYGSTGGLTLNKPVVGMAATPDGHGYWLVASDGVIFAFGDAGFYGSTGGLTLTKPVVGMASTPDGHGYWLVAADGGIFSYGDAMFYGSTGGMTLNKPVVGMAATLDGLGYWLVAADGGIFSYGDAVFYGSTGGLTLNAPIVGMAVVPSHATAISTYALTDVSCPTTTFCMAVDAGGNAIAYQGGQWSSPVRVDPSGGLSSVSCPSTTYCLAVSAAQDGFSVYDGTSWTALAHPPPAVTSDFASVSCSVLSGIYGCAAVSASTGKVAIYYASYPVAADRWDEFTGPNGALGSARGARSLACAFDATDNYDCLVLSGNGTYQTGTNGALNPLAFVLVNGSASASCTSSTACLAGGSTSGSTYTFNGTAFTPLAATFSPTGISCTGTFCAATDGSDVYTSTSGGSWTAGVPIDAFKDAVGISCPSSTFCAVIGSGGDAYLINPSA